MDDDEEQEAQDARVGRNIDKPSTCEVELHNVTHTPYRSWCEHCIKGGSVSPGHKGKMEEGRRGTKRIWGGLHVDGRKRRKRKELKKGLERQFSYRRTLEQKPYSPRLLHPKEKMSMRRSMCA